MPRLTNAEYLKQRMFLVRAWDNFRGIFTVLTYNQQMEVHTFYLPSQILADKEAIAHRKQITQEQPSLPHRAGKLFPRLLQESKAMAQRMAYEQDHPRAGKLKAQAQPRGKVKVKVFALANPEPDTKKIAKVMLELARDMQAEQNKGEEAA